MDPHHNHFILGGDPLGTASTVATVDMASVASAAGPSSSDVLTPAAVSERRRSRTCLVCGGDAESFHLNYGAAACLSCRAFFRR